MAFGGHWCYMMEEGLNDLMAFITGAMRSSLR